MATHGHGAVPLGRSLDVVGAGPVGGLGVGRAPMRRGIAAAVRGCRRRQDRVWGLTGLTERVAEARPRPGGLGVTGHCGRGAAAHGGIGRLTTAGGAPPPDPPPPRPKRPS